MSDHLSWNEIEPDDVESVIRGLKARLKYCSDELLCTPVDHCACDEMLEDLRKSEAWIRSIPGDTCDCSDDG